MIRLYEERKSYKLLEGVLDDALLDAVVNMPLEVLLKKRDKFIGLQGRPKPSPTVMSSEKQEPVPFFPGLLKIKRNGQPGGTPKDSQVA